MGRIGKWVSYQLTKDSDSDSDFKSICIQNASSSTNFKIPTVPVSLQEKEWKLQNSRKLKHYKHIEIEFNISTMPV